MLRLYRPFRLPLHRSHRRLGHHRLHLVLTFNLKWYQGDFWSPSSQSLRLRQLVNQRLGSERPPQLFANRSFLQLSCSPKVVIRLRCRVLSLDHTYQGCKARRRRKQAVSRRCSSLRKSIKTLCPVHQRHGLALISSLACHRRWSRCSRGSGC